MVESGGKQHLRGFFTQIIFPGGQLQYADGGGVQEGDAVVPVYCQESFVGVVQQRLQAQRLFPLYAGDLGQLLRLGNGGPQRVPTGGDQHGGKPQLLGPLAAGKAADDDLLAVGAGPVHIFHDLFAGVFAQQIGCYICTQLLGQLFHAQNHVLRSQNGDGLAAVELAGREDHVDDIGTVDDQFHQRNGAGLLAKIQIGTAADNHHITVWGLRWQIRGGGGHQNVQGIFRLVLHLRPHERGVLGKHLPGQVCHFRIGDYQHDFDHG